MRTQSNNSFAGITRSTQQLSKDFHSFLADVEDLMKETSALSSEELEQTRARLSERITEAKASIEALGGNIAQQGRRSATATNDYVHEQPWRVIGASTAVGLVIGFVLARRS